MNNRYNLIYPVKGKGDKTHWNRCGVAFPRDKGGYSIIIEAMPFPSEPGPLRLLMVNAEEKDGGRQEPEGREAFPLDDDLPFNFGR